MKIVVAGAFRYTMYQDALLHGIISAKEQGIKLVLPEARPYNFLLPLQNAKKLLQFVKEEKPDAVFLYRVENLLPSVVKKIKEVSPEICILMYHNDDPFRIEFKRQVKSFHYLRYIKYADIVYVYRKVNVPEAKQLGGKQVKLYMSHFDSRHDLRPLASSDFKKHTDKVVYIGHCEADYRIEYLDYLFKQGVNLHVYGPEGWIKMFETMGWPIERRHDRALGENYRATIYNASIALAFFSQANRDEYTRRCFEIPVMGTMLMAPRTSVTKELFSDGNDACLFSSKEELLEKIKFFTANPDERDEIAQKGYQHVSEGDFSELSRAKMVIQDIKEWRYEHANR